MYISFFHYSSLKNYGLILKFTRQGAKFGIDKKLKLMYKWKNYRIYLSKNAEKIALQIN